MSANFTEAELNSLEAMELAAQSNQIGFWQIYERIGDLLVSKGVPGSDPGLR